MSRRCASQTGRILACLVSLFTQDICDFGAILNRGRIMERSFHEPRKDLAVYVDDWPTQRRLKRQSVGYRSPNSESEAMLYHHRAFHSCTQEVSKLI